MRHLLTDIIKSLKCEVKGNFSHESVIDDFLFDSRSLYTPECTLFCAITTPSGDGHRYIKDLYRRGVRMFMVGQAPENIADYAGAVFIVVDNVAEALEQLAAKYRKTLKGTVVGITGSAGKTVIKEMIFKALTDADIKASRSPRSWNSRIGVPVSLLEAEPDDRAVIIEAGIDTTGDMDAHAATLCPEIGILAPITAEHDAGFASRREKITEKLRLFRCASTIIFDADDTDAEEILREIYPDKKLVGVKGESQADIDCKMAQAAIDACGLEGTTQRDYIVKNRIDVHEGVNDCVMLYDDFTNDLRSLRPALDFMRRRQNSSRMSTLIMSDLLHIKLNHKEKEHLYASVGQMLEAYGIGRVIGIGKELSEQSKNFPSSITVENVDDVDEFLTRYDINGFSSETILIAGSPQSRFNEIKTMLETPRHDTIFEINLDALVHNFNRYRSLLKPSTGIVAMVKASAYGVGAVEVAKTLQSQGASYLAVAVIDEGVELRKAGISMPIMVLNPVTTNYRALFRYGLEPSVFSLRELRTIADEAARAGVAEFKAHIKLDTGMHRVGFTSEEIPALIAELGRTPGLKVASIFSHLATADCPDQEDYTRRQLEIFEKDSQTLLNSIPYTVKRHILNSAGAAAFPEAQYDLVRVGIGLYGISPLPESFGGLRPVATLRTTIISLKEWPAGTTIGYGRRGVLNRKSLIATLPIGYADGLDRHLSRGAAKFFVKGTECPTVGNICMDQCMIDVTDVDGVAIGDEVEIFGNNMPIERLAETLDTIPYEILTSVSPRVKRIYYRE